MISDPALALWLLLLGPCAGSFLAAFSERFCLGTSMLEPSRCGACGNRLAWRDLVPIVSWVILRGRCRHCGARIASGLVSVEIAGGLLALAAIWSAEGPGAELAGAVWLWCLLGLFLTDRACLRLPDAMTAPLLLCGLYLGATGTLGGLATAAATALAGSAALWLLAALYRRRRGREGLGPGDVKMIAGIGAAVGPLGLPWVTLLAATGALATAALRPGVSPRLNSARPEPFGCALAVAGGLVWLLRSAYS